MLPGEIINNMDKGCKFCSGSGDCCPEVNPVKHYRCTRSVGHKGKHVACGCERHQYMIWTASPVKSKDKKGK
jgi:hypothetical protein